jgi:hypothetical protein
VKQIKILTLTALAAMSVMTFAGAHSAMAESTALCGSDEAVCASPVSHVHETSVGKMKLLTLSFTVECNVLFLGDTLSSLANPLVIHGSLTYTNCSTCSNKEAGAEASGSPGIKVLKLGHETADLTANFLIRVVCGPLDCTYNGVGLKGTAKGPLLATQANGEFSFIKQTMVKELGFLCPEIAQLDITTTPLTATYITN